MTPLRSILAVDQWLIRVVSLGWVLVAGAGLTLAKAATVALSFQGMSPMAWLDEPKGRTEALILDEEKFVPWPTFLPEPAAGPDEADPAPPLTDREFTPDFDVSDLTEGESVALQQLAARRRELDERERMLDMRAELNGQAEERLDQQIGRLADLKNQLETLLKGLDEAEELKIARLVKIYETMKPKAAAEIFNRLEIPILLHVVERMKEAKSAVVLGKMDPVVAKRITTELARKKERPTLLGPSAEGGV
jgi:flagellar motility protein MotE (MotC chaperone)